MSKKKSMLKELLNRIVHKRISAKDEDMEEEEEDNDEEDSSSRSRSGSMKQKLVPKNNPLHKK